MVGKSMLLHLKLVPRLTIPNQGLFANESPHFAARQVLFTQAALSDRATGRLLHGERVARQGFGLAQARTGDADIAIRDWHLRRTPAGQWRTHVSSGGFALMLDFQPMQPPLIEGQAGYSHKGPLPEQASYYYSVPHMRVGGPARRRGQTVAASGEAWLDREWSSTYLAPDAQGWDWTGLNFDDGSALMAFRIRRKDGSTLWAGGSLRGINGKATTLGPADEVFQPVAKWRSKVTGAVYPVMQDVRIRSKGRIATWRLIPMFAAQELDTRRSGLPVYWEGAASTRGGRGYLEMTGYDQPLAM